MSSSARNSSPFGFSGGGTHGFDDFMQEYMRSGARRAYSCPPGATVTWKAVVALRTALDGGEVVYTRKIRVECDDCEGDGWSVYVCEGCGGSGTVGNGTRRHYCPQCIGSGSIHDACETCDGKRKVSQSISTRIRIPAGVVNGSVIVAEKLGKPSKYLGGPNGDLQITIAIKPEGGFKFTGLDIIGTLKIPFSTALLGGRAEVLLPTGQQLIVEVPVRSNAGKRIRLAGCGMRSREGKTGDALLVVSITLPKSRRKLTDAEEAIIRNIDL